MDFDYAPRTKALQAQLLQFFDDHIYPNEQAYHDELEANTAAGKRWTPLQTIEKLKPLAQKQGLWNLWLPKDTAEIAGYGGDPLFGGAGLHERLNRVRQRFHRFIGPIEFAEGASSGIAELRKAIVFTAGDFKLLLGGMNFGIQLQ